MRGLGTAPPCPGSVSGAVGPSLGVLGGAGGPKVRRAVRAAGRGCRGQGRAGGGSAGHPKTPGTAGGPPRGQRWDPHAHAAVPPPCTPKQGRAYLCKLSPGQAGAGGKRGEPWSVQGAPRGGERTPQHPRAGEGLPEAGGLRTPPSLTSRHSRGHTSPHDFGSSLGSNPCFSSSCCSGSHRGGSLCPPQDLGVPGGPLLHARELCQSPKPQNHQRHQG